MRSSRREALAESPVSAADFRDKVGFMQGRFSPIEHGRIQSFPWGTWREEFALAKNHGFRRMEWVVQQERLEENPLMSPRGRRDIANLAREFSLTITSVTCDNFIEEPFYKASGATQQRLLADFKRVLEACAELGFGRIVVPLVDKGSLQTPQERDCLLRGLDIALPLLRSSGAMIAFESDYPPAQLKDFIGNLDPACFGINYDIGNSASLGFDPEEELSAFGHKVCHVHVKDRVRGGTTVPLGEGAADLPGIFEKLASLQYSGDFILQTARAADGRHAEALCAYRDMTIGWLERAWSGKR